MRGADFLSPTAILIEGIVAVSTALVVLFKKGAADSRAELDRALEREKTYFAEREKAMAANIDNVRAMLLIADRLGRIEQALVNGARGPH